MHCRCARHEAGRPSPPPAQPQAQAQAPTQHQLHGAGCAEVGPKGIEVLGAQDCHVKVAWRRPLQHGQAAAAAAGAEQQQWQMSRFSRVGARKQALPASNKPAGQQGIWGPNACWIAAREKGEGLGLPVGLGLTSAGLIRSPKASRSSCSSCSAMNERWWEAPGKMLPTRVCPNQCSQRCCAATAAGARQRGAGRGGSC